MRINEEPTEGANLQPVIRFLGWMTLAYFVSFAAYYGRGMGIWFWYISLRRPSWDLPTWAWTPVWTILFGFIGLSIWTVVNDPSGSKRSTAQWMQFVTLLLAGVSPWVYFAWHQLVVSLVVTGLLLASSVVTSVVCWKVKPAAGQLLIPVIGWLLYSGALEFTVWHLNR